MLVLLGELEFEMLNPRVLVDEFGLVLVLDPGDQRLVLLARLGQLPQFLLQLVEVGGLQGVDLAPHLPHLRVPGAARERGVARRGRLLVREGDALLVLLVAQPLAQVAAQVAQAAQLGAPDQHLLHPAQRHRLAARAPHAPNAHRTVL
jgi:hypothetical protein